MLGRTGATFTAPATVAASTPEPMPHDMTAQAPGGPFAVAEQLAGEIFAVAPTSRRDQAKGIWGPSQQRG
jgi:hypothetical protein